MRQKIRGYNWHWVWQRWKGTWLQGFFPSNPKLCKYVDSGSGEATQQRYSKHEPEIRRFIFNITTFVRIEDSRCKSSHGQFPRPHADYSTL